MCSERQTGWVTRKAADLSHLRRRSDFCGGPLQHVCFLSRQQTDFASRPVLPLRKRQICKIIIPVYEADSVHFDPLRMIDGDVLAFWAAEMSPQ